MPFIRRFGRPGLLGLAARTAIVAGTAGAVTNSMREHQQRKAEAEYEQGQYEAAQQQEQIDVSAQSAVAAQSAPSGAAPGGDLVGELQKLAALRESGALTSAEFDAAKARLLG
ncbi:SHOCT domain-containing protein [Microbacterium sp. NPDC090225]|uniref:SHOCT domain-containing protein n=1 Tax=Microbacterium sp. NPDC090225 TaxID=3364207 RepID=UPI00380F4C55